MNGKASAPDRPAGILTPEQRRFIIDGPDEDLSPEVIRQRWYRIRRQVRNAFIDFSTLRDLPAEEQELIFREFDEADTLKQADETAFLQGIKDVFKFVLANSNQDMFSDMVRGALTLQMMNAYPLRGKHPDISIDIDIAVDTTPLYELKNRVENGGELSLVEFASLMVAERIDEDEWDRYKSATNATIKKG